jgi:tRNA threonylcarbamoyladenosine biosynthesis protein TsaB
MTLILHIETATKVCSVALSKNGNLLALKENASEEYTHGENLTNYIQEVLNASNYSLNELDAVSVASGPGSYTGLRIGVSTAKGLCYALQIPLLAVDALFSLAAIAKSKHDTKKLCALIDARRMEVFSAIYAPDLTVIKPISADIITENSYSDVDSFIYFGDGATKLQAIWAEKNCAIDSTIYSSATGQINEAYRKFLAKEFEDVAYFEPFYLKDFIGTQKK